MNLPLEMKLKCLNLRISFIKKKIKKIKKKREYYYISMNFNFRLIIPLLLLGITNAMYSLDEAFVSDPNK